MKFVLYTNIVSPHVMPLAKRLSAKLGDGNFAYVTTDRVSSQRKSLGWNDSTEFSWVIDANNDPVATRRILDEANVVYGNIRDFDMMEQRVRLGKKTIYWSERWFKPISVFRIGYKIIALPGWIRLFSPRYFRMARRMANLIRSGGMFCYYAIGRWAQRDMLLICRLFGVSRYEAMSRMRSWGYFVEPSNFQLPTRNSQLQTLKLLWVGRMVDIKRVDTAIRAVKKCSNVEFDLYGEGPMESAWRKLADGCSRIRFHGQVKIDQVRELMRNHDLYVLSSNAYEGWGAALNEAIEEGMKVIGTYEAGASATMLPPSNLYHCGDWRRLKALLEKGVPKVGIGEWTPVCATQRLLDEQ